MTVLVIALCIMACNGNNPHPTWDKFSKCGGGSAGSRGPRGRPGLRGLAGADGKSAYDVYVDQLEEGETPLDEPE